MITEILRYFGIATMPRGESDRHIAAMRESTERIQEGRKVLEQSSHDLEDVARATQQHLVSAMRNRNAIDRLVEATRFGGGGTR